MHAYIHALCIHSSRAYILHVPTHLIDLRTMCSSSVSHFVCCNLPCLSPLSFPSVRYTDRYLRGLRGQLPPVPEIRTVSLISIWLLNVPAQFKVRRMQHAHSTNSCSPQPLNCIQSFPNRKLALPSAAQQLIDPKCDMCVCCVLGQVERAVVYRDPGQRPGVEQQEEQNKNVRN